MSEFWWNWWVQFAVAFGTTAAVLVALFGEVVRAKFFPPKLRLELLSPEGEYCPVQVTGPGEDGARQTRTAHGRYYHLRVTNERRWSPAREVQVFLTRVESPAADGQMHTEWAAGSIPMRWRHQEISPLSRTIGPDADCDIVNVMEEKWLDISPLIQPFNLEVRRRGPCHLALTFEARSREINSAPLRVEVHWDGQWERGEREMMRHLAIR